MRHSAGRPKHDQDSVPLTSTTSESIDTLTTTATGSQYTGQCNCIGLCVTTVKCQGLATDGPDAQRVAIDDCC